MFPRVPKHRSDSRFAEWSRCLLGSVDCDFAPGFSFNPSSLTFTHPSFSCLAQNMNMYSSTRSTSLAMSSRATASGTNSSSSSDSQAPAVLKSSLAALQAARDLWDDIDTPKTHADARRMMDEGGTAFKEIVSQVVDRRFFFFFSWLKVHKSSLSDSMFTGSWL